MTLFGNNGFADSSKGSQDEIIQDLVWALNPMTVVFIRERTERSDKWRYTKKSYEKTDLEIRVMYLHANECQELLEATRSWEIGME